MRVLIGTMSYYPNVSGVAVTTRTLAKYLKREGHEVFVVAPASKFADSVEEIDGIKVFRLRSYPNPIRRGYFLPFYVYGRVKKIMEEVKPDIVHLHDPMAMNRYIRDIAHQQGAPAVATNHFTLDYVLSYFPKFLRPEAGRRLNRWMVRFYNGCDVVTCPTETVAIVLKNMGVTKPIVALSNGVDTHRFYTYVSTADINNAYHLPNWPVVLYLGRIDKDKSLNVLVDAVEEVIAATPAHFVIAGGGSNFKQLLRVRKKEKLQRIITMTGPIPHDSLALVELYQRADIFVMPSSIETQSIVTMEAMAAGKPIVAARGGALPELVEDGQNGLLFAPNDSRELARALIKLLQDEKLRERMGVASLKKIAEHELEISLKLVENLYEKCLEK